MHAKGPTRSDRLDALAARAAQLFVDGAVTTVAAAIDLVRADAADRRDAARLTEGRVRQHVEAMTMTRLGAAGAADRRAEIVAIAEELMTLAEESLDPAQTLLVGRGASGRLDGDVTLHIRIYTDAPVSAIAAMIVDAGHEEPTFRTAETRRGRLDRIELHDGAVRIVVTRCPPALRAQADTDLHTGRRIETLDLPGVRSLLSRCRP